MYWPCQYEIHFFMFLLLCCWDDFLFVFRSIFDRCWGRKCTKIWPKIDEKMVLEPLLFSTLISPLYFDVFLLFFCSACLLRFLKNVDLKIHEFSRFFKMLSYHKIMLFKAFAIALGVRRSFWKPQNHFLSSSEEKIDIWTTCWKMLKIVKNRIFDKNSNFFKILIWSRYHDMWYEPRPWDVPDMF